MSDLNLELIRIRLLGFVLRCGGVSNAEQEFVGYVTYFEENGGGRYIVMHQTHNKADNLEDAAWGSIKQLKLKGFIE